MKKEKPLIFSDTIEALKNTAFGAWPAEPIDPEEPFKWMTRRVIKPRYKNGENGFEVSRGLSGTSISIVDEEGQHTREEEPRFWPDDIIWVRETFQIYPIASLLGKGRMTPYAKIPKHKPEAYYIEFAADNPNGAICGKWRSPLFLPRWAARFLLEVKSVRVERLHDITEEDARAEGAEAIEPINMRRRIPQEFCDKEYDKCHRAGFIELWERLNAKIGYSWDSNPWVCVIEFMRVK